MTIQARHQKGAPSSTGGQFKTTPLDEAAGSLVDDHKPSAQERLTALYRESGTYTDQAAEQVAAQHLLDAEEAHVPAGYLIDYIDTFGLHLDWTLPSAKEMLHSGVEIRDIKALIDYDGGKLKGGLRDLLDAQMDVDRVQHLVDLGVPARVDALTNLNRAHDDVISEWVHTLKEHPELSKYVGTWNGIGDFVQAEEGPSTALAFVGSGVTAKFAAEYANSIAPGEAAKFAAESKLAPERASEYLDHNLQNSHLPDQVIDAKTAKEFGPNFAPAETLELRAAGVPGKTARSLRGADKSLDTSTLQHLARVGYISGAEYKQFRDITAPQNRDTVGTGQVSDLNPYSRDTPDQLQRLIDAKKSGVPADIAAEFNRRGLRSPYDWATIHSSGVTDLAPWHDATKGTARTAGVADVDYDKRATAYATGLARFIAAGGTPERLGTLQRAGFSLDDAWNHVKDTDPWAAGASHRAETVRREQERLDRWGRGTAQPWEWDETTYQG